MLQPIGWADGHVVVRESSASSVQQPGRQCRAVAVDEDDALETLREMIGEGAAQGVAEASAVLGAQRYGGRHERTEPSGIILARGVNERDALPCQG